jgi:predicted amidohydrolase
VSLRKIPVACIQLAAHDRAAFDELLPRALTLIERATRDGARLIVLPEGTVPAYVLGNEPVDRAQLERAETQFARLAREGGATIVFGGARTHEGRTYNEAIAIGPDGRVLGSAPKRFLWHFDRRWFAPGATLDPIDTPLGRIGLLVCADGRIPTIAATLAERGAELLVMPTAWVTSGRNPQALENVQADLLVPVRARENRLPFVAANKCGVELQSVAYCGKSLIVSADGDVLARGSETREEIVHAEIDVGARLEADAAGGTRYGWTPFEVDDAPIASVRPTRARIAFTLASDPGDVARFASLAATADANVLIACGDPETPPDEVALLAIADASVRERDSLDIAGIRFGIAGDRTFEEPRALVAARLDGIDVFVWNASGASAWHERVARARATELRAYVVVLARDAGRAFACDPDGTVVAGTFDDYRLAAFAYDRARSSATQVAPHTDVLDGLRTVDAMRASA